MSIFVLAVGLVSVGSLLPVAGFQAQRAQIDDRKSAAGMNAAREFRTRGFLRADLWLYANAAPPTLPTTPFLSSSLAMTGIMNRTNGQAITAAQSFPPVCIDPCMVRKYGNTVNLFASNGGALTMPRLTSSVALGAAADQACMSQDDLKFTIDESAPDALPTGGFNSTNTKRAFEGRFSWLATLVPIYGDPISGTIPVSRNSMLLSIVVFNQRPTAVAPAGVTERAASATFSGVSPGIGAGELVLSDSNINNLAVNVGEWIMLGTMILDPNAPGTTPQQQQRPFFRWYRVVAAGPAPVAGQTTRALTVTGPEWNLATVAQKDANGNPQFYAFIYDGAVAVYERTVHLEGPSMWSN